MNIISMKWAEYRIKSTQIIYSGIDWCFIYKMVILYYIIHNAEKNLQIQNGFSLGKWRKKKK